MKIRTAYISDSILDAVASNEPDPVRRKRTVHRRILRLIYCFFRLFKLVLARYRGSDFANLRQKVWKLDEREYIDSFEPGKIVEDVERGEGASTTGRETPGPATAKSKGKAKREAKLARQLKPVGDLGYSGSTFFTTPNSKYLVKSLPRRFEHEFFTHDLFDPYLAHMREHPHSLLVRITDMVYTPHASLGGIVGTAPTHHIIMENLLYGQPSQNDEDDNSGHWQGMKWETYDLKPVDYFFPERDLADGMLASESVKAKIGVEFPDRLHFDPQSKSRLMEVLEADTQLLADNNAIDYSLFLVRFPGPNASGGEGHVGAPTIKSDGGPWRTGMADVEGKWTYRVVVLDFFWARHKFRPQAMTGLVKLFNKVAHKGPMSITANPQEYRGRFLKMVKDMFAEE